MQIFVYGNFRQGCHRGPEYALRKHKVDARGSLFETSSAKNKVVGYVLDLDTKDLLTYARFEGFNLVELREVEVETNNSKREKLTVRTFPTNKGAGE